MTICACNARTPASDASVEDLMMQARKIKCSVIGLTETRRNHPLHGVFDAGEGLFLGTQQRRWWCLCPRQHELGHEHRFVRTTSNSNRTFTTDATWINAGVDVLRSLCTNIGLQ
ncbi:unnamed protein product [Nippostrongylus brasiliensis]|uniref:Endo/exonuclease/phosphatase domain-containing protein n=1 Tax=Nippostrongylus brasiliensis TaxID=27835 RepID=A0A0N4Y7A7_NIPBR|nr:unnamed protein product [Nippostrongylus brasiliensis]